MRWEQQTLTAEDAGALPGLGRLAGLVRTVRTPEFAGTTFHEVHCRSALNHVPSSSRLPFRWTVNPYRGCTHGCVYCLAGDTQVLMADGTQRAIANLQVGDLIVGTEKRGVYRRYVTTEVLAHFSTQKPAYRITLGDGTTIVASGDHRFLTGRGWKHVTGTMSGSHRRPYLTNNDALLGFGRTVESLEPCEDYQRGYLCGMIRGDANLKVYTDRRAGRRNANLYRFRLALADEDGLERAEKFLTLAAVMTTRFAFSPQSANRRAMSAIRASSAAAITAITALVAWPDEPSLAWQRGFLAGIFDAEGSRSQGVLRISNRDADILDRTHDALTRFGFDAVLEDRGLANGVKTIRLRGGLREQLRFTHLVDPAIRRKCVVEGIAVKSDADLRVTSIEPLGLEKPMFDITTGTGDFIANGVISHNCFARNTHTYLDLDAGQDFDSQIVVKINVASVLRRELARASWARESVAMGTNTDPYQRAEGRYRLMPDIISALTACETPFSILTKGTLLSRDLPLLSAAAERVSVGVSVSLAVLDPELQPVLEPGTPTPRARLELIRRVRAAGLPCGVLVAPILPHLTDSTEHLAALVADLAAAGATSIGGVILHLRPGAREWFFGWLERSRPDLVAVYRKLYARGANAPLAYRREVQGRLRTILNRTTLDPTRHHHAARPLAAPPSTPEEPQQLSLL